MAVPLSAKVFGSQIVPQNQSRKIDFTTVEWDTGGFHSVSQSKRLRVKQVQAGRYIIQLAVRWHRSDDATEPPVDPTSSYFYAAVLVNNLTHGGDSRSTVARAPHARGTTQLIVHETDLVGGDRIQAQLWHGFDELTRADVYLQLRRLGDSVWLCISSAGLAALGGQLNVGAQPQRAEFAPLEEEGVRNVLMYLRFYVNMHKCETAEDFRSRAARRITWRDWR
jgi:hypothetical protein